MRILAPAFILALLTASPAAAIKVQLPDYTYVVSLPTINAAQQEVDSSFTAYEFTWVGPLSFNAAPNSACPLYCGPVVPGSTVEAGYSYNGLDFTAAGTDSQVDFYFANGLGSSIKFTFIESDSFWASIGTQTFPADSTVPATSGVGASYVVNTADPGCTSCSVVTSSSLSQTPEPSTWFLSMTGLAGLVPVFRRRRA